MNLNKTLKSIDRNYLLLFLIVLVGFVLIDCNTKMFSKLLEGNSNSCGAGNSGGAAGGGSCGKLNGVPDKNPANTAKNSCNLGAVNSLGNNNNNNGGLPQGYTEGIKEYVSATGPLGREIPKTLQGDFATLKSFGLTNLKEVVNYIPGDGPAQFITGNRDNNNAAGKRNSNNVNRNNSVNRNNNVNRNNSAPKANTNANNAKNSANSNGKCKPVIYGSMSCGWTKKQLKYMDDKGLEYEYIDCAKDRDACPKEVSGFPTIKHCDGTLKPGYQEL